MIGVVDYRAGNAPSVMYALERIGVAARLVSDASDLGTVDRVILPGVGAARATIDSLEASGLVGPLQQRVRQDGVPFLGICIGLQVLFDHSEEGDTECLGWLPGTVRRFPPEDRVPQIGWNGVTFTRAHPVIDGLPDPAYCYFVNSFYVDPADPNAVLGLTQYSVGFCSVVAHENVVATQFHAEKSGEIGLRLLANFAKWDGAPC